MRPLPRLLAFADARVASLDDLGVRAAAIAAAGPSVALVARCPGSSTDRLASLAQRFVANATAPMASVLVTGRADVAMAAGAHGVILRKDDLHVDTVRELLARCRGSFVLRSVHSFAEAQAAVAEGADAVIVGAIWPSASHPDAAPAGTTLLNEVVTLGVPVYAIGGVTSARAAEVRATGAWGVAAISAVWDAPNAYQATMEILQTWN